MSELLKGADWRSDDGTTAGEIFVQLQRVDILCVVVHVVAQHADIEVLRVRRERADLPATQEIDIGHSREFLEQRGTLANIALRSH